jgi:hypothetical protein
MGRSQRLVEIWRMAAQARRWMPSSLSDLASHYLVPAFWLWCVATLALFVARLTLVTVLRASHTFQWRSLGSPAPLALISTSEDSKNLWAWVCSREYREMRNRKVSFAAETFRIATNVYAPIALIFFLVFCVKILNA